MLKIGDELMEAITSYLSKPFINVVSSRQFNTIYTNNKDYPIQVMVSLDFKASSTYRQINIFINNTLVGAEYLQGGSMTNYRDVRSVYFFVAPGQTYELKTAGGSGPVEIYIWRET